MFEPLLDNDQGVRPRRRTALIASELRRYHIDIAALSETRFAGKGSLTETEEGYTFIWSGLRESLPRMHGVGFAVRNDLMHRIPESQRAVSERISTWRILLQITRILH